MRRRAVFAAVLIAVLAGVAPARAQAPAPLYGGQLLYSTVTVQPGEIKTWTVTCPPGHVLLSPWIAPPPARVTVTERIIATSTRATSFRAVSQAKTPVQVTVAVTCLKVRPVKAGKRKPKVKLTFTVTPQVRVRVLPRATQTVRLTCPPRTTPIGPSVDIAPVTSPRGIDHPARMVDVPARVLLITRDRVSELGLHNFGDVLHEPTVRLRCGTLVDEDGDRWALSVLTRDVSGQVGAGQQAVVRAACPRGGVPIGIDIRGFGDAPAATLAFPRALHALDLVSAAPGGNARHRARARCLRGDTFRRRGSPPGSFDFGPLEDQPPGSTPPAGPAPGAQPGPAGTGSFADVPGFPLERSFTLTFNRAGTGMRIRTPGHQVTNFIAPAGMNCTPGGEQLECLGTVTPGVPLNGRIALMTAAAVGDQGQIVLLTDVGPTDPFSIPLIP